MSANNIQLIIEILLKNKSQIDALLAELKQKYNIDIDVSELDSAAEALKDISGADIEVTADGSQAIEEADQVEKEIEEIPEKKETEISATGGANVAQTVTAVSTAYTALMNVINQVKDTIGDFIAKSNQQEKSSQQMKVALAQAGDSSILTYSKFKNLASEIQRITTIGDETTMGIMRLGLNMGILTDDLDEATKNAIGLAKGFNLDLTSAMKMVALAGQGDYNMLKRYIPALRTARSEEEAATIVKKAYASGWAMATAEVDSGYGAMESYTNLLGDVKEKIGDLIKTAMIPLVERMSDILDTVNSWLDKPISESLRQEQVEFNALINILKDANTHEATREEVIIRLQNQYGSYLGNLDLETASYEDLKKALQEANQEFERKIAMTAAEEILTEQKNKALKATKKLIDLELDYANAREKDTATNIYAAHQTEYYIEKIERQKKKVKELNDAYDKLFNQLLGKGLIPEPEEPEEKEDKGAKKLEQDEQQLQKLQQLHNKYNLLMISDKFEQKVKELDLEREAALAEAEAVKAGKELIQQINEVYSQKKLDLYDQESAAAEKARLDEYNLEMAHIDQMDQLYFQFYQQRLNYQGQTFEAQMRAIGEYYLRNRDKLIEAGISEQEITEQIELAKEQVKSSIQQRALQGTSRALGNLARAVKNEGEKGFIAWKAMSIAQAIVDTYTAANSAYKSMVGIPVVGPTLATIAAAAAYASGMANVNQIRKQKYSRGGVLSGQPHSQGGIDLGGGNEAEDGEIILNKNVYRDPILRQIASLINVTTGGVPIAPGSDKPVFAEKGGVVSKQPADQQDLQEMNNLLKQILNRLNNPFELLDSRSPEGRYRLHLKDKAYYERRNRQ